MAEIKTEQGGKAAGQPEVGSRVLFSLIGNDGWLNGTERKVLAITDDNGRAQVSFSLGTRAAAGGQVVEAVVVGVAQPVSFRLSAKAGPAAKIFVDTGDQQTGAVGQRLPNPFVAVVTDQYFNRLPGVDLRFELVKGTGLIEGEEGASTVTSGADGRAVAFLVPRPFEGIASHVVRARLAGESAGAPFASFVASTQAVLRADGTTISGLVLDNVDRPVPGVTLRIAGTELSTQTHCCPR